jgi:hypothetical protein
MKGKHMAKNWQDALDEVQAAAEAAADRVPWRQVVAQDVSGRPVKAIEVLRVSVGNRSHIIKYHLGTDGTIYQTVGEIGLRRRSLTSFNMETLQLFLDALEATYPDE